MLKIALQQKAAVYELILLLIPLFFVSFYFYDFFSLIESTLFANSVGKFKTMTLGTLYNAW
jgi:hypothetical protein